MSSLVLTLLREEVQVVNGGVQLVAIDMVHRFTALQLAAESLLHVGTMYEAVTAGSWVPVTVDVNLADAVYVVSVAMAVPRPIVTRAPSTSNDGRVATD